jgi:PAS domain S-box-containing protein
MGLLGWGKKEDDSGEAVVSQLPANLQDETTRFKVIIDSIEEGVILIDDQQIVRLINPGASALCGWKPEEATNLAADSVVQLINEKGEPYPDTDNPLKQIFLSDKSLRGENVFLMTHDKRQIPISLHVSPLMGENNRVTAAVAVLSDISKERAEEAQRADFISTASHEMRTPVAAIEGYLALALNQKVATVDSRAREYLEKALNATHHLGELFQDLLTSAKAEDGRLTSHPQLVELGEFLEQLSSDLRLVAEKKELQMDFVSSGSNTINATSTGGEKVIRPLYYVYADPDRLREVVTNIFDNAVKYTDEGAVSLGITGNDKVVQCYVKDTGPGIPAEDIPHLFQKFYRVDNSATRTIGGTGLGLFICRKIIELYSGRIWAESTLGEGSTFYINLPRISGQKLTDLQSGSSGNIVKPISTDVAP